MEQELSITSEVSQHGAMPDLEKERNEILARYRQLFRAAKPVLKGEDAKQIKKAFTI